MSVKLGLDGKLYRNTGTYAVPVWNEVKNVKDLTLNLEKGEADVSTRGNNGWRALLATLKDGSIEFEMVWDTEDDDFVAFRDSWFNNTAVELAVMDGDITVAGTQGLRALMMVFNFTRTEALEEAMMASVTVKPTYSANPPAWLVVP
jgi:hypothetical protein